MKNKKKLPDFQKLCQPEQKHIAEFLSLILFFYFLTSIGGYFWEVFIFLKKDGIFRNRGFLYGPWLPVYGVGAVIFYVAFHQIKTHPIFVFLLSAVVGSSLEFLIGWFLDTFWNLHYWDYSDTPWNISGYICLYSALGFAIAGTLWVCLLSQLLKKLWFTLPKTFRYVLNSLLVLLLVLDASAALIFPNRGTGITFPH